MKLTPRAKQALENAAQLARELGHSRIGSQHMVYGLFQLGPGVSFNVLRGLGFTAALLKQVIIGEAPVGAAPSGGPPFDLSASAALKRAGAEVTALGHEYVGTEHILLALLAEEHGGAAHIFASRGVDIAKTRKTILKALGGE